jgi:hypothetical protein
MGGHAHPRMWQTRSLGGHLCRAFCRALPAQPPSGSASTQAARGSSALASAAGGGGGSATAAAPAAPLLRFEKLQPSPEQQV